MTETLLSDFYKQNAFQLGEFTLKSGVLSPIYVDLRTLISSPKILEGASRAICNAIKSAELEFDYVVGVPYGAMALATLVSHFLEKPMIFKRKEAKSYGQKKLIEGCFVAGKRVLIVEDVVTSGASILETAEELRKVDLICEHAVCVLDREQGGTDSLRAEDITLHSIISMTAILDFLTRSGVITEARKTDIQKALKNPVKAAAKNSEIILLKNGNSSLLDQPEVRKSAPQKTGLYCCEAHRDGDLAPGGDCRSAKTVAKAGEWSLTRRQPLLAKSPLNKRLVEIILKKKSNLCLAADFESADEILAIAEKVKGFICALKIHYDIVKDFSAEFVAKLQQLANDFDFIIFEDRKFADIGKVMEYQVSRGSHPIANWADVVTVHSVVGSPSVSALTDVIGKEGVKLAGCLLIAELSSENNLTKLDGYAEGTIKIAKENSQFVSGFICQKRFHDDPSFLYWTPGVNLSSTEDGAGQQWRTVERAIVVDGCDIIIVGRGICAAADALTEARRYAHAGWEALTQRD